jgi:hypothetical protein
MKNGKKKEQSSSARINRRDAENAESEEGRDEG